MTAFLMMAATVAVTLAGLAILCVVATRPGVLDTGVGPFGPSVLGDPAADTMAMGQADPTVAGDWKQVELSHLCDAEELLDCLETSQIRQKEFTIVADDRFLVRWR